MPLEYITSMPEGVLNEFMALNAISPFTTDAEAYRQGLMTTLLYNNNASKQADVKSVKDLFPYLDTETPDWLEDERVKKVKDILKSIKCHSLDLNIYEKSYNNIKEKVLEEIDIEMSNTSPDMYVVEKLKSLIGESLLEK